jgi:hypothetical protein
MRALARRMRITRRPLASPSGPRSPSNLRPSGRLYPWDTFGDPIDGHHQHFHAMGWAIVEEDPRHVRPRLVTGGIGGRLGDQNHAEVGGESMTALAFAKAAARRDASASSSSFIPRVAGAARRSGSTVPLS